MTTISQAILSRPTHGKGFSQQDMFLVVAEVKASHPSLVPYLNHPTIIVGLLNGKIGMQGLNRILIELRNADSQN